MKKFKFSIVMAVYNTAAYLEEAILSIVKQSIGFKKNVQLILVNDGSSDNSGEICQRYQEKYKHNIIYINKENGGVSTARNVGIEQATGELVNFLDGDDLLSKDTLSLVYDFYQKHKEEVDLISIPMVYFEARQGNHVLNRKFVKTRVIDIMEEPTCFQMSISSSFVKREVLLQYHFNEHLKYGEDAEVVNKIILNRGRYGVVREAKYLYRARQDGGSAIQNAKKRKEQYMDVLKYLHFELMDVSKKKYGEVIPYLQNMMMYETIFKIRVPEVAEETLTKQEIEEFFQKYQELVKNIDDDVILGCRVGNEVIRLWALQLKYGKPLSRLVREVNSGNDIYFVRGKHLISVMSQYKVQIDGISASDDIYQIEGNVQIPDYDESIELLMEDSCVVSGISKHTETCLLQENRKEKNVYSLGRLVCQAHAFTWELKRQAQQEKHILRIFAKCQGTKVPLAFVAQQEEPTGSGIIIGSSDIQIDWRKQV